MQPQLLNKLKRVRELQQSDESLIKLQAKPIRNFEVLKENDIVYIKPRKGNTWKLFLPVTMVSTILKSTHEQFGHASSYKLYEYISRQFFWRGMKREVKNYTK